MEEEALLEPLVSDQEGYDFPLDESLLKELAALDAAESGGGGGCGGAMDGLPPGGHVEDEDVLKMKELIREKPKDVIQYLEEEGVVKLGELEVQDAIVFRAFEKEQILTTGNQHFEVDWESMWRERLSEYARPQEVKSALGWSTKVIVEAHVVNLRDAAAEGSRGLLHPLLKRFNAHACSATVFALPAVQAVINFKWTSWARTFLLYELLCYCLWLGCFTAFTLLFQQEDWTMSLWQSLEDRNGFLAVVFSLCSLLPMSCFFYMELCTIAAYGWGWLKAWNVLDMASYILQVVICVLHLQRTFVDEGWFSVLVATQQVLLWIKLHYFAKAFSPTKNTIVDTVRILLEDLKWFLALLGLTMVGFALSFYALFRQDRSFPDFANIWHAFASMFSYLLGMFDYNVFYGSSNPTAAMLLFIVYEFTLNVLLLNVLIASMTNSFSKITQDEGLRLLLSKAEIIDELEATLPQWVRSPSWYPTFVHILKIHPDATYEVNLNSVWSGMGLMENNLLGAQQETRLRVEELEDRLSKLHKKLDVLIKLFISSLAGTDTHMSMLSRQATALGPTAAAAAAAAHSGGSGSNLRGGGGGGYFSGASPKWQGRGGVSIGPQAGGLHTIPSLNLREGAPSTPMGPFLRHAMSTLGQLPEQLAAVSGPLTAASLHLGGHAGGGGVGSAGDRALPRRSGPPGFGSYYTAATPEQGLPDDGSSGISRVGSGTAAGGATMPAARGTSYGQHTIIISSSRQAHHHPFAQQQMDDLQGAVGAADGSGGSFTRGTAAGSSSGLVSVGSGHIGPLLAQQQVVQLLAQQQYGGGQAVMPGYTAPQLVKARLLRHHPGSHAAAAAGGLKRSNSV